MNYGELKSKAVALRKKGLSYNEIKKEINVSKSTLSLWLKHVALKKELRERLYTKQIEILSRGSQSQKERRAREIDRILQEARKDINLPLNPDADRLMGAALYWGEGSKTQQFQITNSDPHLILFFVKWVERIFKIQSQHLKAWLNIYPQQNENKIKRFWSDLTNIPLKNFGKSYVKPISGGYKKNNLYYGTIRVTVPKSTDLRYKVLGWLQKSLGNIGNKALLTQEKWGSLKKTTRPVNLQKTKNSIK